MNRKNKSIRIQAFRYSSSLPLPEFLKNISTKEQPASDLGVAIDKNVLLIEDSDGFLPVMEDDYICIDDHLRVFNLSPTELARSYFLLPRVIHNESFREISTEGPF